MTATLAHVAARRDISDRAFRVYTIVSHRFAAHEFTLGQAADATGLSEHQVAQALGELRTAGLYTGRKRVVGYDPARARVWRTVYRKVGEVTTE